MSSCSSVGRKCSGTTLTDEGLFRNGSSSFRSFVLQPCTEQKPYTIQTTVASDSTVSSPAFPDSGTFTNINCVRLLLLHQAVPWSHYMLEWQKLVGLSTALPMPVDLLSSTQYCSDAGSVHQLTQQLISTAVLLAPQKPSLRHLPLRLSWNILYILWSVPKAAPGTLTLS